MTKAKKHFSAANEAIELSAAQREDMLQEVENHVRGMLKAMRIEPDDHNTEGTPKRVAKMFINEIFRGRFEKPPALTAFENVKKYDQMIMVGPIEVESTCAHHLLPFRGSAYIGILPGKKGKLLGLSKYARVVEHFARRPQIQEELTQQIFDYLLEQTKPDGLAVRIISQHLCMCQRGVGHRRSHMTTMQLHGKLRIESAKAEFQRECLSLEGHGDA